MTTNNSSNSYNLPSGFGAGLVKVSTQTASNQASIPFTGLDFTKYRQFLFIMQFITPATNNQALRAQVGNVSDGYLAADYSNQYIYQLSTGSLTGVCTDDADSYIKVSAEQAIDGSSTDHVFQGTFTLAQDYDGTYCKNKTTFEGTWQGSGARGGVDGRSCQSNATTNPTTQVQFYFASGNVLSGTVTAYGLLL